MRWCDDVRQKREDTTVSSILFVIHPWLYYWTTEQICSFSDFRIMLEHRRTHTQ